MTNPAICLISLRSSNPTESVVFLQSYRRRKGGSKVPRVAPGQSAARGGALRKSWSKFSVCCSLQGKRKPRCHRALPLPPHCCASGRPGPQLGDTPILRSQETPNSQPCPVFQRGSPHPHPQAPGARQDSRANTRLEQLVSEAGISHNPELKNSFPP